MDAIVIQIAATIKKSIGNTSKNSFIFEDESDDDSSPWLLMVAHYQACKGFDQWDNERLKLRLASPNRHLVLIDWAEKFGHWNAEYLKMVLLSIFGPFQHGTSLVTLTRVRFPPKGGEGTLLYNMDFIIISPFTWDIMNLWWEFRIVLPKPMRSLLDRCVVSGIDQFVTDLDWTKPQFK